MLNRPSSINDNAIDRLPQVDCKALPGEFPTVTESLEQLDQTVLSKSVVWIQEGQRNNRHDLYSKATPSQEQNVDLTRKHLTQSVETGSGKLWQSLAAQPDS